MAGLRASFPFTSTNMTEIVAPGGPIPDVPTDLTIPQFLLDVDWHPTRPPLLSRVLDPCMIEDATGRAISFEEVSFSQKASPLVECPMMAPVAVFDRFAYAPRRWQTHYTPASI